MKIDPSVLQQLANFGVSPLDLIKGAKQAIVSKKSTKANNPQDAETLKNAGYIWSNNDNTYNKGDRKIYAFGNVLLWTWGNAIGRALKSGSNLSKWISGDEKYPQGKESEFISKYNELTGQPSSPIDRMSLTGEPEPIEHPPGPVPDRSMVGTPPSEVDQIIAQAKKEAGQNQRLHPDKIIDLYNKAKEVKESDPEGYTKLMMFIKTLKSLTGESIKRSHLNKLIQEIVRRVVREINQGKLKEMTTTAAVSPVTSPKVFKKNSEEEAIEEMTTTSAVSGYNVPGAFTNKMDRKDRIEVLGYTMTPEGKKEYNRPGDKKL